MERASGEVPTAVRRARAEVVTRAMVQTNSPWRVAARLAFWRWLARRRGDRPWRTSE